MEIIGLWILCGVAGALIENFITHKADADPYVMFITLALGLFLGPILLAVAIGNSVALLIYVARKRGRK